MAAPRPLPMGHNLASNKKCPICKNEIDRTLVPGRPRRWWRVYCSLNCQQKAAYLRRRVPKRDRHEPGESLPRGQSIADGMARILAGERALRDSLARSAPVEPPTTTHVVGAPMPADERDEDD